MTSHTFIKHRSAPSSKKLSSSKETFSLHAPSTSLPPRHDFILFSDERKPHQQRKQHTKTSIEAPKSRYRTHHLPSPSPPDHVIINPNKAATPSMRKQRIDLDEFKCLQHISSLNCTHECRKAPSLPTAPPAPMPPRLPTPELEDVNEGAMWGCCSFRHDAPDDDDDDDDDDGDRGRDDALDAKIANALAWQQRCREKAKRRVVMGRGAGRSSSS